MLALLTEAVSELLEEAEELDSELLDETALEEVLFAAELLDELDGFPQPAAIVNAITETTDIVISFFILFFMVILLFIMHITCTTEILYIKYVQDINKNKKIEQDT